MAWGIFQAAAEVCAMLVGKFLFVALHYWKSWLAGTGAMGGFLILYNLVSTHVLPKKWRHHVNGTGYLIILFLTFWILGTFFAWRDADKNLTTVTTQRQDDNRQLNSCSTDLKVEQGRGSLLDSQNKLFQTTITSQQQALDKEQQFLNAQQGTVNTCVLKLSELNPPQKISASMAGGDLDTSVNAKHHALMLLVTNRTITPIRIQISCDKPVVKVAGAPFGAGIIMGSTVPMANGKVWQIEITSPAWTASNPILIEIYHNNDELGECHYGIL
jgi:hypothetical protein